MPEHIRCLFLWDDSATEPCARSLGALAKELGGTLAFDAVGAAMTKALVLGMPPKSRVCVYGALGGGGVDVGLAGQLLGTAPSSRSGRDQRTYI